MGGSSFGGGGGFIAPIVQAIQPIASGIGGATSGIVNGTVGGIPILGPALGSGLNALSGSLGNVPVISDLLGPEGFNLLKTNQKNVLDALPNISEPGYPGYNSIMGSNGLLKSQYNVTPDSSAINQLRSQITNPSPWAGMQTANQAQNFAAQKAGINNMPVAGQAQQFLNMRGGATGSDAGMLSQLANRSKFGALENLAGQNQAANLDIKQQAEGFRQNAMNALPGLEQQQLQPQQQNIQNALTQNQAENAANLAKYQSQMQAWAAGKTGKSIASSGKK